MPTESSINWTPIILVGAGYFILKDLLEDDEETEDDKTYTKKVGKLPAKDNPFNYATFVKPPLKTGKYRLSIDIQTIIKAAQRINDGFGYVTDDEAEIMSGIKLAGTKTDIAVISKFINSKYKYDIYEKMKKNLNKAERGRIDKYVLKLPDYKSSGYKQ